MNAFKLALAVAQSGPAVFGLRTGTEEPRYILVTQLGRVEIRQYAPRLAASITVQGDEITARSAGFRRLAAYIFGANTARADIRLTAPVIQSKAEIAMTAPVAQAQDGADRWTITFYMPAKYALATLPNPVDPEIALHAAGVATYAVYRFSGARDGMAVAKARERLLAPLEKSAWQAAGEPVSWLYDPPWTLPWARRNEVAVPVKRRAH
jgi:hypothetical protein